MRTEGIEVLFETDPEKQGRTATPNREDEQQKTRKGPNTRNPHVERALRGKKNALDRKTRKEGDLWRQQGGKGGPRWYTTLRIRRRGFWGLGYGIGVYLLFLAPNCLCGPSETETHFDFPKTGRGRRDESTRQDFYNAAEIFARAGYTRIEVLRQMQTRSLAFFVQNMRKLTGKEAPPIGARLVLDMIGVFHM